MKGGYQIIDLTNATAGDPVTIAGTFDAVKGNNGKVMLIKTADGEDVYAQAKEVDGDYVITYLSAEGKTVKVTITDENAVTTVIEDDAASIIALTEGLNEINDRMDANIMHQSDVVDLSATTVDNPYTTTHDGYLYIKVVQSMLSTASENVGCYIFDPGTPSAQGLVHRVFGSSVGEAFSTVFVKKGMRLAVAYNNGTGNEIKFVPLVSE